MEPTIVSRNASLKVGRAVPVGLIIIALSLGVALGILGVRDAQASESRIQFILDNPSSQAPVLEDANQPQAVSMPAETLVAQADAGDDDISAMYRRGKSLYRAGEYAEAISVFEQVLKIDSAYERAQQYLAEAKERLELEKAREKQLQAERLAQQKAEAQKARIDALLDQAEQAADMDEYDRAIKVYSQVLNLDPGNRDAERGLSRAERDKEKYLSQKDEIDRQKALEAAKQKEQAQKEAWEAKIEQLLGQADAALEADDFDKSINLYQKVLQMDERNRSAERGIKKAEKAKEDYAEEQSELAAEMAAKKAELAAEKAEMAARKAEMEREAKIEKLLGQADASLDADNYDGAIRLYTQVIQLDENNRDANRGLEKARKTKAEFAEMQAERTQKEAEMALEAKIEQLLGQADAALEVNDFNKAQDLYSKVLNLDDGNRAAERGLSKAEKAKEDYAEEQAEMARREAEEARKQQEEAEKARLEQEQLAAKAKQKELEEKVDNLLYEADERLKEDDYDGAITALTQVMSLDPENRKASKKLEKAQSDKAEAEAAAVAAEKERQQKALEKELAQYIERAKVYLDADQLDQADAEIASILSKDPENAEAKGLMDRLLKRRQEIEAEQTRLAEEAKLAEKQRLAEQVASMSSQAKELYAAGDVIKAHEIWNKVLEIQPDHAETLAFLDQTKDAYQAALTEQKQKEAEAAKLAEIEKLLNQNVPLLDLKDTDIDNVLSLLGTISGFNIVATEGVEGPITVNIRNKTVREALDMILTPMGFKYNISGKDITVTTNFKTRIFPLEAAAYAKVAKILEDPTSLEDPTKELRRLVYGELGESPIPGRDIRLNPNTRSLIVTDTDDNIKKVEAFLADIPAFVKAKEPLESRHFKLNPDWAKQVYRLIELQLYGEVGKRSLAADDPRLLILEPETNMMIVKDTIERIKEVEAILNNQALLEQLKREELVAKEFQISVEPEPPEGVSRTEWLYRREQEVNFVIDILTQMLYGFEGQEEAIAKGRRIFKRADYNLEQDGTITVVDTPENIKKVENFLSQAQGRGQTIVEPVAVKHADINALRTLLDRVTGRRRDSNEDGGSTVDDDRQDRIRVTFTPDPNSQTIIIRARSQLRDSVESIKDLILKLDVPIPQVEIEARLVEIRMEDNKALTFDWDFFELFEDSNNPLAIPGGVNRTTSLNMISDQAEGMALSLATFGNSRFEFAMNWLENLSNAEILSAPKITVTSDSEATINIVSNEPYISDVQVNTQGTDTSADDQQLLTFAIEPVGIEMTVTPTVLGDNSVVMDVNTSITAITGRLPLQLGAEGGTGTSIAGLEQLGQPVTSERSAITRVRVKDGDTLVIGGLIRDEVTKTISKVPLVGDIPYLGRFFQDTSDNNIKGQLLIFMTVRILPTE